MKSFQIFRKALPVTTMLLFITGGALVTGCQKSLDIYEESFQVSSISWNNMTEMGNVPFKADFITSVEITQFPAPPDFHLIHHLSGYGTGSHIGQSTYDSYVTLDLSGQAPVVVAAPLIITAANGDKIFVNQNGTIIFDGNGAPTVNITGTITGGTGRFANASGDLTGTVVSVTATTDAVSLNGSISY